MIHRAKWKDACKKASFRHIHGRKHIAMDDSIAVQFDDVSKIYPGVKALTGVSFSIRRGEIHALLGENGAGKSTLLNILHGVTQADGGDIHVLGEKRHFAGTTEALAAGIAKVHQEIHLVPQLTVGQNIALGFEPRKLLGIDFKEMYRHTDAILASLGCRFRGRDYLTGLSVGEMQMIVIAKALFHETKIISFDEPTASLSKAETDKLFETILSLKRKGITMLYVSHKLDEVFQLADRASILRDGSYILTTDVAKTDKAELIRNMVGRDVSSYAVRTQASQARPEVALEVDNLCGDGFFDISFQLRRGEILGFSGLVGSKRTEVVRTLFGADRAYSGTIRMNGAPVTIRSPEQGLANGIGLLTENRKTQGFIPIFSNCDNMALTALRKFSRAKVVSSREKRRNFDSLSESVRLNIRNPDHLTANLSGGNQQKVILAKWLSSDVDVLIFDEPTKGVDVGAKSEIYALMEAYVATGKSIILVSSELPEIIGMCDRALVMRNGRIVAALDREDFSEETLLSHAMETMPHVV